MTQKFKKILLLLGDFFVLNIALALTLFIRYNLIAQIPGPTPFIRAHWTYFLAIFAFFIIFYYIQDLYNWTKLNNLKVLFKKIFLASILSSILAIIYFYLFPSEISPKTNLIIFMINNLILSFAWRFVAINLLLKHGWQEKLIFIGSSPLITELELEFSKNKKDLSYLDYSLVKTISSLDDADLDKLSKNVESEGIKTIVLAKNLEKDFLPKIFPLINLPLRFFSDEDFYELMLKKVPVENIDQSWFFNNLAEGQKNYFDFLKRIVDFFLSIILLLLSLPFSLLIAILIKLNSPGPAFFVQKRLAKQERIFSLYKFRSMKVSNDFSATQEEDKRITSLGRFLRKTRLDELPQLFNILKGDLSFIGPRPERVDFAKELSKSIPFYNTRLLIKPGLSGWDQVSGEYHSPSVEDTLKKLQNDLYYIKHRSIYLDLKISLKTITSILAQKGR